MVNLDWRQYFKSNFKIEFNLIISVYQSKTLILSRQNDEKFVFITHLQESLTLWCYGITFLNFVEMNPKFHDKNSSLVSNHNNVRLYSEIIFKHNFFLICKCLPSCYLYFNPSRPVHLINLY